MQFLNNEKILSRIDKIVYANIFISFVIFALETIEELKDYYFFFKIIEILSLITFLIEYAFRIFLAKHKNGIRSYVFSFIGLVDLISIVPLFLLPFHSNINLGMFKLFRLLTFFRIFKVYRYSDNLQTMFRVIENKRADLLATLYSIFVVLIFCSSFTYYFEKDIQPEKFNNFFESFYWSVCTLSTIGYGDIYPMTFGGKMMAILLAILGIGLVALPAAILSAGYIEEVNNHRRKVISHLDVHRSHLHPLHNSRSEKRTRFLHHQNIRISSPKRKVLKHKYHGRRNSKHHPPAKD